VSYISTSIVNPFITCSQKHVNGSYNDPVSSSPQTRTLLFLRSILILFSHQSLRLQGSHFRFEHQHFVNISHLPKPRYVFRNSIPLHPLTLIMLVEEQKALRSLECNFIQPPVSCTLLDSYILSTSLFYVQNFQSPAC
jgi:hypothetical protein